MVMIGSGENDEVEALLREQVVVIDVGPGSGRVCFGELEIGLVDVAEGGAMGAGLEEVLVEIAAAPAGGDDAVGETVVGSRTGILGEQRHSGGRGGCKQEGSARRVHRMLSRYSIGKPA